MPGSGKPNLSDFAILALLSEGPLSGYDIKKLCGLRFSFFLSESFGQIYPALGKMHEAGWLSRELEGRRKLYAITGAGRAELLRWMNEPPAVERFRFELLLKLFYSPYMEPQKLRAFLEDFRKRSAADLETLLAVEAELSPIADSSPNHRSILAVVDLGKRLKRTFIEWADDTLGPEGYRP